MTGKELREKFLEYFERHGHTRVRSSSLLPANDPTLLFTNAGMNQFKDAFLGREKRDYSRAASSQKCIRAGGKHNDLDEVGKTARHHTFFEMLGNFSFGDYFKEDAIKFAWDLLVNELKLDPARLWFSVFEGDEEVGADEDAEKFWEQVGAPRERILRFGRKDNFWQMGETGPCGPCSEIHYYMGDDPNDPTKNRAALVNGPGDDTMEIWNLVFMQFERSEMEPGQYKLEPLPAPSVDTGAGLERLAVVLQGVKSNYDTDLIRPIIDFTAQLADRHYEPETQSGFAMRVIADHARATAFAVADGILPGNEWRNYVLRKIMRRAIYQGRNTLGFEELFFYKVTNFVVDEMHGAYPELEASRDFIGRTVTSEEERFGTTLTAVLGELDSEELEQAIFEMVNSKTLPELQNKFHRLLYGLLDSGSSDWVTTTAEEDTDDLTERTITQLYPVFHPSWREQITGPRTKVRDLTALQRAFDKREQELLQRENIAEAFSVYLTPFAKLYDTYGAPRDLIRLKLEERGFRLEEEIFNAAFDKALRKIQPQGIASGEAFGKPSVIGTQPEKADVRAAYERLLAALGSSEFTGYEKTREESSHVVGLIVGANAQLNRISEGMEADVILDRTPFYAESGGQVGDSGTLVSHGAHITVNDTISPVNGLIVHRVTVDSGILEVGDEVVAQVDIEKRDATRRNHTATHLLHAALREVLGGHVIQAGSVVAPNYLRFDYSHNRALTEEETAEIERLVNNQILRNTTVQTEVMPVEDAIRAGAMALFGEKYAGLMRVLTVPGFSKELCGGTHVRATGDIGLFKITSDESIASGVRRIRAVTGVDAYERFRQAEMLVDQVTSGLRVSRVELASAVGKLQEELKKVRREADELRMKIATGAAAPSSNGDESRDVAGVQVLAKEAVGLDAAGMRQLSDTLLARIKSGVVVLGRSGDGKASLIVRSSADVAKRVPAGQVIKELAPIVGGRGGGKPDMAEGGGNQPEKLAEALEASYKVVEKLLA